MRKTKCHLAVALSVALFLGCILVGGLGCPELRAESAVPLPKYEVGQPSPADPPEVGQLLGTWTGNWEGKLDSVLVITDINISDKTANVIYAWGDSTGWNIKKGYQGMAAEFVAGTKPTIKWGQGGAPQFEFILKKGKLQGSKVTGRYTSWVTMTKQP